MRVKVDQHEVNLTNLDKEFWPREGYTKGELLHYYAEIGPYLLPHLEDRPIVLVRHPDGIDGESFYQKETPDYAPEWVKTAAIQHSEGREVHYTICNDLATLLWMVNQGAIEIHPWFSRWQRDDYPDIMVLDLDPEPPSAFAETLPLALAVREALKAYRLEAYTKTSGATGVHVCVPITPAYTYHEVAHAAGHIARAVARAFPAQATVERMVRKRGGRVYLDYLQNLRGKTVVAVYSPRPRPGATVSMPVTWEEVAEGRIRPTDFNIKNALERVRRVGDLFSPLLTARQDLTPLMEAAGKPPR